MKARTMTMKLVMMYDSELRKRNIINPMGSNAIIHELPENEQDQDDLEEKDIMCEEPKSYSTSIKKAV